MTERGRMLSSLEVQMSRFVWRKEKAGCVSSGRTASLFFTTPFNRVVRCNLERQWSELCVVFLNENKLLSRAELVKMPRQTGCATDN